MALPSCLSAQLVPASQTETRLGSCKRGLAGRLAAIGANILLIRVALRSGIFGYINYLVEKDRKFILDTLVNGEILGSWSGILCSNSLY